MVLVIGESGTGKSTSLRNCDPATTAVVNPVGKPLPFKNHFDMLNNETDARKICKWMHAQAAAGKKLIAVDDFQYILAVPYMHRIQENGWDKWNDFGSNYFEILEVCKDLPDDVVVVYYSHMETLENGLTTIKLLGKMLREKITIEGLFTVVLRTGVNEAKYYFYTQNSGKDTVKSPLGMFPAYAIDNDINYVADKLRNYYEVGEYRSDADMRQADQAVAADVEKPDAGGRRSRNGRGKKTADGETGAQKQNEPAAETSEPSKKTGRSRKTHDEVVAENNQKMADYLDKRDEAVSEVAGDAETVDYDVAEEAAKDIPKPELETPPRRTRAERKAAEVQICDADTYFYIEGSDNYVMRHTGEAVPEGAKVITKEEFGEGIRRIATRDHEAASGRSARTRRSRSQESAATETEAVENEPVLAEAASSEVEAPPAASAAPATRRTRRVR